MKFSMSGSSVASNAVQFTVTSHPHNLATLDPLKNLHRNVFFQGISRDSPEGFVDFAGALVADTQISAGIRDLAALRLAEYHFLKSNNALSISYAQLATASQLVLPCGGFREVAIYYKARAAVCQAQTKAAFDAGLVPYDAMLAQFTEFPLGYMPQLYPARRAILPP